MVIYSLFTQVQYKQWNFIFKMGRTPIHNFSIVIIIIITALVKKIFSVIVMY